MTSHSLRRTAPVLLASTLLASALVIAGPVGAQTAGPLAPSFAPTPTPGAAPSTAPAGGEQVDRSAWLYAGSDIPPDAGWQFGTLRNGLRFAVRRNGVPPGQVSIRLRVDAGSLMERPEEAGWAHLIEHLGFRESRYLPSGEARRAWQRLGVAFGSDSNATTGATSTVYQLDIPAATPQSVGESIRLLSGMIRDPVLSNATIGAERPIVIAERRERDGPAFRIDTQGREHMFAGQLLGERSTIGTEQTLAAANADGLRAFHARWYRPERVVIAIAGDFDPAVFERAIVTNFADWRARGPAPVEPDFGTPTTGHPATRVIVEPSQPMAAHLAIIRPWHRVTDSIAYTQGLMIDTLAQQIINRRLEERARSGGRFLVAQIGDDKPNRSADITSLTVVPLDNDWEGGMADARAIVAAAQTTAPTAAEITREYTEVETFLAREFANAQNEAGTKQAEDLLNAVDIGETTTSPDHALAIWRSIRPLATPARLQAATRRLMTGTVERAMLITPVAVPDGAARLAAAITATPQAVAAAARPAGRPVRFADLPSLGRRGTLTSRTAVERFDVERWELGNGVTALVRNTPIEPDKIRVMVRWGAGRRGESATATNLLWAGEGALVESGVGRLDISALDRLTNGRQIGMRFDVDDDAFEMTAETTPRDLADQLRLLATKLAVPGWQPQPVARARAGTLATLDAQSNSPMAVMESSLRSILLSGDKRFAPPTRAEVEALTPAAFRAFWEPRLAQGPIEIQVFGDLRTVDLEPALLASFGALAPRPPVAIDPARADVVPTAATGQPIVVRHSGEQSQAAVILAYPTGGGLTDIRTGRQLEILAAIFNDRLFDRLRDQSGASYSQAVSSSWTKDFASGGYLFAGGLVRPTDQALMLRAAREIAADLARTPVSADELRRATGPAGEQIVRAASGNVFWMNETEGATRDPQRFAVLRNYLSDLTNVSPATLQTLARTYLTPAKGVTVLILPQGVEPGASAAPAAATTPSR